MALNPALIVAGAPLFVLLLKAMCKTATLKFIWLIGISGHILESCFSFLGVYMCLFSTCTFCCAFYRHVFSSPPKTVKGGMSSASKNCHVDDRVESILHKLTVQDLIQNGAGCLQAESIKHIKPYTTWSL